MPARTDDDTGASAPRALLSRAALIGNAEGIALAGAVADLRRDAWGHGRGDALRLLAEAGVREALVESAFADDVRRMGLTPVSAAETSGEVLYGLDGASAPVMTLEGTVLATKALLAGEGVSYGYRHRAPKDTRVALVTGGYAQGVARALGGRASVTIDGARHAIVGRVAMDVCMVDIGDADIPRHATATFFGDAATGAPTVAEWADATGLTAAELVTAVGLRSTREWTA